MSKALETGKSFLSGVLAKLPEGLRNKPLSELLGSAEASDFLTSVGDGALARADYSRLADELKAQNDLVQADHQRLTDWWEAHKDYDTIKAEYLKLKAGGDPNPNPNPPPDPSKFVDIDTFNKTLLEAQQGAVRYLNTVAQLVAQHQQDFGEVIDPNALVEEANRRQITILDAYKVKYGDKLKARADELEQKRINKLVEERLATERAQQQDHPYPLRNQAPSVLDVLTATDRKPADYTVDTAAAEYERLQAARG